MSSRELFNEHVMSEDRGKNPIFLFDLSLGMDALNVPTTQVFPGGRFDGELAGKAVLALQRHLGHDGVAGSYQSIDYSAFGGAMHYPEWGTPYMTAPPFADASSFYDHEPSEIEDHMDGALASYATIRRGAPDVALLMNIPAPMSVAVPMRGLQTFLLDLLLEPDFAREQIKFGGEVTRISIERVASETELDAVLLTAAFDNLDIVGPDILRSFSFGGLRRTIANIRRLGLPVVFHPHSVFTADDYGREVLGEEQDMGVDCLYYGESNDPHVIRDLVRGRCSLMGGIDTFTTIYLGPDERVGRDVNECMGHFEDEPFLFSCSCSVDRGLPLERMRIMVDAVRGYRPRTAR